MLLQAMPQMHSHVLFLPWEQGPMQLIFGSAPALPELPKVSPAEWPDKVTDGESLELVEEAAILAAPGAVALSSASHASCPLSETCLLLKRRFIFFWLIVLSCCCLMIIQHPALGSIFKVCRLGNALPVFCMLLKDRPRLPSRSGWRPAPSMYNFAAMLA